MGTSGRAPLIDAGVDGGRSRRSKSVRSGRIRHGIERFFFLFAGGSLRPLVPLVAAPAERVQRPRPQCDAPNPCPVPCQYGGENTRIAENTTESLRSPPV